MQEDILSFPFLLKLRESDINTFRRTLETALDEDLRENADMFDLSGEGFTGNLHPNKTMRTLEQTLERADRELCLLLRTLVDVGKEWALGLDSFADSADARRKLALYFADLQIMPISDNALRRKLTEPKAEHLLRWLTTALEGAHA